VVENLRLADGTLFPIPVTLDLSQEDLDRLEVKPGARLALRDPRDEEILAVLTGKLAPHSFPTIGSLSAQLTTSTNLTR
jgi:ATP sulfurylase